MTTRTIAILKNRFFDRILTAAIVLVILANLLVALLFVSVVAFPEFIQIRVPIRKSVYKIEYCFPVAGNCSYSNDWHAPRYIPYYHLHEGTDIFAPRGTPVYACVEGKVEKIGTEPISGNFIGIRGRDKRYYYYAHLETWVIGIEEGNKVRLGQIIGYVGNTGNARGTPPHLHFGIKEDDVWINPYPILKKMKTYDEL
ncbi:MAG: M23 family metallopeptidase [Actinomycetota bacterium]|nr:M23 family metallopeptidase [Actinomycetota bacterium]